MNWLAMIFLSFNLVAPYSAQAWNADSFKKPSTANLKKKLTSEQFSVTQDGGTERPFANVYWDQHDEGIYVDIVSGEPLFSSKDKYDSGTGWPSFKKPLVPTNVNTYVDKGLMNDRVEVRSRYGNSHLGHVFDDGPPPTGERYCMNSASLRFIPKDKLKAEGYEEFAALFSSSASSKTLVVTGGSFWPLANAFTQLKDPGVLQIKTGFIGGHKQNPTFNEVANGGTGHRQAVQITYDPKKTSMEKLLETYWLSIDPFDAKGSFCDKGEQFTSAIYIDGDDDKSLADKSKEFVRKNAKIKGDVQTKVLSASQFWPADDSQQDYAAKNSTEYQSYLAQCARAKRGSEIWGNRFKQ